MFQTDKVLIGAISAHHPSRAPHAEAQRQRLKNGPVPYKIIYGTAASNGIPDRTPLDDELFFNVDDRKEWMVLKNKEFFKYALEHGYEYVFRCCDDSIVYPDRLLEHYDLLSQHDYAGTMCGYANMIGQGIFTLRYLDYMHGGVGIWLSRRAMEMLIADDWKGPYSSPLGKQIELTPEYFHKGNWHIYWDDLWIGEVLRGNLNQNDPRRNAVYQNYLGWVLDSPELFASYHPFDPETVIATHSLDQMGTSSLHPKTFSTRFDNIKLLEVDWTKINSEFKQLKE